MPLQNRVMPDGAILAMPERGSLMGNRGRLHDGECRIVRPWATRRWIACELAFRGRRRDPMGQGYTSLFFLDEATALAAGHRPCFECRREDARRFIDLSGVRGGVEPFDRLAHESRLEGSTRRTFRARLAGLPDGVVVRRAGAFQVLRAGRLLPWTAGGYRESVSSPDEDVEVVTPRLYVDILSRGYRPRWLNAPEGG